MFSVHAGRRCEHGAGGFPDERRAKTAHQATFGLCGTVVGARIGARFAAETHNSLHGCLSVDSEIMTAEANGGRRLILHRRSGERERSGPVGGVCGGHPIDARAGAGPTAAVFRFADRCAVRRVSVARTTRLYVGFHNDFDLHPWEKTPQRARCTRWLNGARRRELFYSLAQGCQI